MASREKWLEHLPTVEEMDAQIASLEAELERLKSIRSGIYMIRTAVEKPEKPDEAKGLVPFPDRTEKLSAKEFIVRVLQTAGRPLLWNDIQRYLPQLDDPPTVGALTNAFYHNTKGGSKTFVALGNGFAGLAGRDEEWTPPQVED